MCISMRFLGPNPSLQQSLIHGLLRQLDTLLVKCAVPAVSRTAQHAMHLSRVQAVNAGIKRYQQLVVVLPTRSNNKIT